MIQPEEIRRKAQNLYEKFLRASVAGEQSFFPRAVPADRNPGKDILPAIEKIRRLRAESKEAVGYGYTVEWEEVRSRTHGLNQFPKRIAFVCREDLLRYLHKEHEFAEFAKALVQLRAVFPCLLPWATTHIKALIEIAPHIEGLVAVAKYLEDHPRPACFARELPLAIDTKFVSRHTEILRQWLDIILPPHTIRADEEHFERRFGLRYIEPNVTIRFLDTAVQFKVGSPWPLVLLPLESAAALKVSHIHVIVVENRVNLSTLPTLVGALAVGGMGDAASLLRYLTWLADCSITYWGDLDVQGFNILSRLRASFPHTRSLFMDVATLEEFRPFVGPGSRVALESAIPPYLTPNENAAFQLCLSSNLRLEQERIPQGAVTRVFSAFGAHNALLK